MISIKPIVLGIIVAGVIVFVSLLGWRWYNRNHSPALAALSVKLASEMTGALFPLEGSNFQLPYRLYVPKTLDPNRKYPLIVTLHGAGGNGSENVRQLDQTVAQLIELSKNIEPTFVLVPQSPRGKNWVTIVGPPYLSYHQDQLPENDAVKATRALIQQLPANYPIDMDRIYVTGFSAGAAGSWDLLTRAEAPPFAAAAAMLSGAYDLSRVSMVSKMPLWFFHGREDNISPFSTTLDMVEALREAGATPRFTLYDGVGHDTSEFAARDGVYTWLLMQRRSAWYPEATRAH